jgi:hypothetical protein
MPRSRAVGWGMAASALAHVVVIGLILGGPVSRTILEDPVVIELELAPKAGRAGSTFSSEPPRDVASHRSQSAAKADGRSRADPFDAEAVQRASIEAGSPGAASGPMGDQGEDGTGVESRWKVAPRGRDQPRAALKPDCSISNPEYIWPGREAFCAAQPKPEPAREL